MTDLSIPALLVFHFQLTNYPAPLLLEFEPTLSIAEFILQSTHRIRCIYRLWRTDIELVEGQHAGITTNSTALVAPVAFRDMNETEKNACTLVSKYIDNYTHVSFFVRPISCDNCVSDVSISLSTETHPTHLCSLQ